MPTRTRPRCSLTALRTFEAVARTGSLSAAAEDLHVSVAAVSFQLKEMQERLGIALVGRTSRGIRVTPEGEQLAADLSHAFGAIDRALEAAYERQARSTVVTISTLPMFASRWLLPRLVRFQKLHPQIEVRLTATERLTDLDRDGVDLAVRVGPGPWPGVHALALFPQAIAPVCRRSVAERYADAIAQGRVGAMPLIANSARPKSWESWARDAGLDPRGLAVAQVYENSEMAYQAVLEGLGTGLVDLELARQELAHGELVQTHPHTWVTGWTHCLVKPADRELKPAVALLYDWIVHESKA